MVLWNTTTCPQSQLSQMLLSQHEIDDTGAFNKVCAFFCKACEALSKDELSKADMEVRKRKFIAQRTHPEPKIVEKIHSKKPSRTPKKGQPTTATKSKKKRATGPNTMYGSVIF